MALSVQKRLGGTQIRISHCTSPTVTLWPPGVSYPAMFVSHHQHSWPIKDVITITEIWTGRTLTQYTTCAQVCRQKLPQSSCIRTLQPMTSLSSKFARVTLWPFRIPAHRYSTYDFIIENHSETYIIVAGHQQQATQLTKGHA